MMKSLRPAPMMRLHRKAAWIAGLGALLWGMSGIVHPLMVWTGPQPAERRAPPSSLSFTDGPAASTILTDAGIDRVADLRIVAGVEAERTGGLLRVAETADRPARYFRLADGGEVPDYDRLRAEALARHYLGEPDAVLLAPRLVTQFDSDYPAVNRLLPVWRVELAGRAGLAAHVDTATGLLAATDNRWKRGLQFIFRNVHSLAFLPEAAEPVRLAFMILLVGSIAAVTILGAGLLALLRARKALPARRRWHRLVGYAAVIPALMFSISGLWMLLYQSGKPAPPTGQASLFDTRELGFDGAALAKALAGKTATGASLIATQDGLRLRIALGHGAAVMPGEHDHHGAAGSLEDRTAHFAGQASSDGQAVWLDARDGRVLDTDDANQALPIAIAASGLPAALVTSVTRIDRFTDEYGFANKRLPVWRIAYDTPDRRRQFVDTGAGFVVSEASLRDDRSVWVFSTLHKWRFLDPLGIAVRDALIVTAVSLILVVTLFGWWVMLRGGRKRQKTQSPVPAAAE